MADFHTVLKRAIAALPDQSGPNRRAVYDKARKALLKQLQGIDPPLPAQEVTQQRLALEDAIRKVEAEIARAARGQTTAPEAPASAPSPRPAAPRAPAAETGATPDRPAAPRAPARPTFPSAPRPAGGEVPPTRGPAAPRAAGPAQRPVTPPQRPGGPARPAGGASSDAAPPQPTRPAAGGEPSQRRREPGFRRPATPTEGEGIDWPESKAADRAVPSPGPAIPDPHHRTPPLDAAPAVPDDDELSEEEIEAAAAEAEVPEVRRVPVSADRRGWLRRRGARDEAEDELPEAEEELADEELEDAYDDEEPEYGEDEYVDADEDYDEGDYDETYYEEEEQGRRRSFRWLIAPVVILVILAAGAFALYSQRDTIMAMLSSPSSDSGQTTSQPAPTSAESDKISDRLNGASGQGDDASVVAPDARSVRTTRVVSPRGDTPAASESGEALLPGTTPEAGEASDTPAPAETASPAPVGGGFDAVLYEEGASPAQGGNALRGSVSWEFVEESIGGQPPEPVVRVKLSVPARDMETTLLFRKNDDSALPASHLIEVSFTLPPDFPGGGIANVPGLIMKQTESAQGNALLGASAKVSDNLFWIALSASPSDEESNLLLLKDRSWIDIPLLYESGGRAILTLNKGPDGTKAVNEALAAWGDQ